MITNEEFFEELKAAGFNVLCPGESPGERANEISVMSDIDFKVNPDYNIEEDPNLEVIIPKYLSDLIDEADIEDWELFDAENILSDFVDDYFNDEDLETEEEEEGEGEKKEFESSKISGLYTNNGNIFLVTDTGEDLGWNSLSDESRNKLRNALKAGELVQEGGNND